MVTHLGARADLNGVRMFVNGFVRNVFVNMVRERLERLVHEPCLPPVAVCTGTLPAR